ncbi:FRG domain-containing protein [Petralouisia muris]|jgi:hypothetical protein|uniref:FRG domain-containing protein n=1 Tax=Petralouisia muris TaxID=3032872 RepID=A0AC61S0V0_9FIRM|nr:FRG domain-containing protein [Petralouisia muris]TGY97537.1 FRG domain-containing protein [Petralouisia muris]
MEQVNSITDYLKIIDRYRAYSQKYYRGQLQKYKTIPSSVARDQGYALHESDIYHESIKMKADEFRELHTPIEKLAKLQHYGIPTRLVDVTIDPLIALYFAVENVEDLSPGNVYLYLANGFSIDSKEARTLSILPTISALKKDNIRSEYERLFGECLSDKEILELVDNPVIIQYSEELQKANPRLYSQQGTFLICANAVINGEITDTLKSLDTIEADYVIHIPYEYKKKIKDELDLKYGINRPRIYPELPSVADYIKEKYKEENISLDGKYSIVKKEDVSHALARRISITIVLNDMLQIDQIKNIVINVIEQHKHHENVIWVYVARNGDDYILSNWILYGQWIDPRLNKKYHPIHLKNYEDGYYWEYNNSYSTMAEFYQKNIFDEDKNLFIYHKNVWKEFLEIYEELLYTFQNGMWNDFIIKVNNQKSQITNLYMKLSDFGHSHDTGFDDFLKEFSYFMCDIDNVHYWIENKTIPERGMKYQVEKIFQRTEIKKVQIKQGLFEWENKLQITNQDYQNIDPLGSK